MIKVEPPTGDPLRAMPPFRDQDSWHHHLLNAGKENLVLDLKARADRNRFYHLVEQAAVVLEGFKPGVADRLGVGWDALSALNPKLVYCSISAYGQADPRPAHDLNVIAEMGLLDLMGASHTPPLVPPIQIGDLAGAYQAAISILGALQRGGGERLDISLAASTLPMCVMLLSEIAAGHPPVRGEGMVSGSMPCYRVYETRDRQYLAVAAIEGHYWATFCEAIGQRDWIDHAFDVDVIPQLEECFRQKTLAEWLAIIPTDVCVNAVQSLKLPPSVFSTAPAPRLP